MFTRNHTCFKNTKGQTLVEFALVLALFLAILFGITEFGRAWYYSNHLTNTVRAAARYAAVLGDNYSDDLVRTYVEDEIDGFMNVDDIESILVSPGSNPVKGDTITVTVRYNFTVLSGSIIPAFSGERTIERSASMRFEG